MGLEQLESAVNFLRKYGYTISRERNEGWRQVRGFGCIVPENWTDQKILFSAKTLGWVPEEGSTT